MALNLRTFVLSGLLIIGFLTCAGCTQSPVTIPAQMPVPITAVTLSEPGSPAASKEEMAAFVKVAVTYAKQNGKQKALAEFSDPHGSFFRGVLYIYAYDMNGTTIAHPVNPEKIGINRLNEKDAEGNLFIRDLRQAAINGTGFATYYYINPTHNNAVEKKLGYAMSVDPTWWLGSGIYLGPADTPIKDPEHETPSAGITPASPGK